MHRRRDGQLIDFSFAKVHMTDLATAPTDNLPAPYRNSSLVGGSHRIAMSLFS